jgi:hypothetical protein
MAERQNFPDEIYPGKIIPFKPNAATKTTFSEEEILDEGEIVEVQPVKNQTNSNLQNSEFIEINKNKSNDIVYLNVTNLSNQRIKVRSFFLYSS